MTYCLIYVKILDVVELTGYICIFALHIDLYFLFFVIISDNDNGSVLNLHLFIAIFHSFFASLHL